MSNKSSNKLSQLLFRRSSTNSGPMKPPRSEICYQHQNQSHYENLMSFGRLSTPTSSVVGRDYDKEEDSEDENSPLIPIAIPQLVENSRKQGSSRGSAFGRVVIFADKSPKNKMSKARSCSPSAQSRTNSEGRLPSILKNSSTSNFYEDNYHAMIEAMITTRSVGNISGKSTLQRAKSSPVPSTLKKSSVSKIKSIPVPIPSPPTLEYCSAKLSRSNPLLNVSWNCPTLEKRKDVILNYFKNFNNKPGKCQESKAEPIYEEIGVSIKSNFDSLKPKLSPKKVRLNLLPSYENSTHSEENLYQHPIYDNVLDKSSSFCTPSKNNWAKWEDLVNSIPMEKTSSELTKNADSPGQVKFENRYNLPGKAVIDENDNVMIPSEEQTPPIAMGLGLAKFASQVAQQAKANQSNKAIGRSSSFGFGGLGNFVSSSFTSSNNHEEKQQPQINSTCLMDEIYLRLDKRGKKFGTPTTRLLKRHHSQNLGKSFITEEFYINTTSTDVSSHSVNTSNNSVSTFDLLPKNTTRVVPEMSLAYDANMNILPTATDLLSFTNINNSVGNNNSNGKEEINQNLISNSNSTKLSAKSEDSDNFSMDSACEGDASPEGKPISTASEDSYYSCTNSSNSSSSEEESESRQVQGLNPQHPPVRPPRATTKVKSVKKIARSSQNPDDQENSPSVVTQVDVDTSHNFITNVSVDKEGETKSETEIFRNQTGFINLADVFPHIDSQTRKKSVLTISVIDSTQSTPTSYPYPVPIEKEKQSIDKDSKVNHCGSNNNHNLQKEPPGGCINWEDWYRSLKKGTVLLDDKGVLVTHQTPKDKDNPRSSSVPKGGTDYYSNIDFDLENFDSKSIVGVDCGRICEKSWCKERRDHFLEKDDITNATMSAPTLMTPVLTQDDKLPSSSGLLITTESLWDNSLSPSPPTSSTSPNSHSSEPELSSSSSSTTTTSDLSETSVQLATIMTESESRNQFIRQESKYYDDDVEEDGGFESFQVLNGDGDRYEEEDDEPNSHSDENEGQFLGISDSAASRQRTFAQLSQNVPEHELKQKASSVLDLINAEISDLHMRELELKKKNRVADGKQDYENDSEDLVEEGSSQADSDDYTDSAVDVESYSRTSNSSGNVTPADREKSQERDRASSKSPQSPTRGSYHPAEAEDKQSELVVDVDVATREDHVEDDVGLLTSTTSASSLIVGISTDGVEVPSSGTTTAAGRPVGVKVRPIVEEEVKSIELSVDKETPIEREIRLVRDREEEFRRQRIASANSVDLDEQSLPTSPFDVPAKVAIKQKAKQYEPDKKTNASSSSVANAKSVFASNGLGPGGSSSNGAKDIQYEMATARLKREIEDNLMRERELFKEGRLKSLSAPEPRLEVSTTPEELSSVSEDEPEVTNEVIENVFAEPEPDESKETIQVQPDPKFFPSGRRVLVQIPSVNGTSERSGQQANFQTSSPVPHSAPAVNAMRFFSPSGFAPSTTNSTQSLSLQRGSSFSGSTQPSSLSFSKPQFTSIERMILKGSFAFNKNAISEEPGRMYEEVRMTKVSLMPDPLAIDPLQIVHRSESLDETEEGEIQQEEIKPRRKYIPAQDKIQIELQDQMKRETELSQLRSKCKSTPDLSKSDKADEEEADDELVEAPGLTKPSTLRRQMSSSTQKLSISEEVTTTDVLRMNKPTVRRRHSALINQWEEMIKQQQQKNNKN